MAQPNADASTAEDRFVRQDLSRSNPWVTALAVTFMIFVIVFLFMFLLTLE